MHMIDQFSTWKGSAARCGGEPLRPSCLRFADANRPEKLVHPASFAVAREALAFLFRSRAQAGARLACDTRVARWSRYGTFIPAPAGLQVLSCLFHRTAQGFSPRKSARRLKREATRNSGQFIRCVTTKTASSQLGKQTDRGRALQHCLSATPAAHHAAMRPAHPTLIGGGLAAFDTTTYAPPSIPHPRPAQVPRQILSYDDFPFHAELYNPYSSQLPSVHQSSIAQQAGLPIAGLPAEPSAVGSAERQRIAPHELEAGYSRPQDLHRATTQLDALEATGSARPSSGKRRYCQYGTGTATPSSGSLTLVHAPPPPPAPAPLGPSLQLFDPDVPIWPQSAPAGGPNDRLPEVPPRQAASLDPQHPKVAEQPETIYSELPAVDWRRPQTPADHVAGPHAVSLDLSLPDPASSSIGASEPGSRRQASEGINSSTSQFQNDLLPPFRFAHIPQPSPPAAQDSEAFVAKSSAGVY